MTSAVTPHFELPAELPTLNGIRGVAILLVLIHTTNVLTDWSDPLGHGLARLAGLGWVGVQLFFVLSGFLITRNLLKTQGAAGYFRAFYGRRFLRIFPLYYATLLFFFVVLPLVGYVPQGIRDDQPTQIWLWLFLSNWTQQIGWGGLSLPHFWSLAVEEQFYLLWPLVVFNRTPKQLLRICALIAIVSLGIRCYMVWRSYPPLLIYTSSLCRMDALAMGASVAAFAHMPRGLNVMVNRRAWLLGAAVALLLGGKLIPHGFGMTDPAGQTLGYSMLGAICALVIAASVASECLPKGAWGRVFGFSWLRNVGKYSYAMYVFHAPLGAYVGVVLLERLGWRSHPSTAEAFAYEAAIGVCTYALAWCSYHLLEKHFLKLKRHFVAAAPI